jgi:hypothetical protein
MTPGRRERPALVALADPARGIAARLAASLTACARLAAATGAPVGGPSTEWPHDLEERLEVDRIGMVDRVRHLVDHDLFKQLALALAR